jgi:excisionase family DNA binding protein
VSEVRHLPVPEAEPFMTREQFAEMLAVHVATVDRMIAAGMPSLAYGRRVRRIQPSRAMAWIRERQAA